MKKRPTGRKAKQVRNRKGALPRARRAGRVAARGKKRVFEMHVWLAVGEAKAKNDAGFREGQKHSLLVFIRQPSGGAADEALARKGAAFAGWKHVKLERSRHLEAVPQEPTLRAAYEDALALGCSVVADRRALKPAGEAGVADRRRKESHA
jgi:hypothetical protein